jgi:hypothetical protein
MLAGVHGGGLERGRVDEGFDGDGLLGVIGRDILEDLLGSEGLAVLKGRDLVRVPKPEGGVCVPRRNL